MTRLSSSMHYIYGRPVRPDEFLGRTSELRTTFNRIRNGESTVIVGDPHIGKTSFLLKLADQNTQKEYIGKDRNLLIFSNIDLHPISSDYNINDFWDEALCSLRERPGTSSTSRLIESAVQSDYNRRKLVQLFDYLGQNDRCLVLLLDEFERLLLHPNFQVAHFFALLRSLATRTGGLALVAASRISVARMNQIGRGMLDAGSPFFNNFVEVRLRPLDDNDIGFLLDRAGQSLSIEDRLFIRRLAGRNPFLLQAMTGTLLEAETAERQIEAAEKFYERIAFHFDDLWGTMDDSTRTTAVILALVELGGRALGQDFSYGEIENIELFGPELRKLAERGLADFAGDGWQFDSNHLMLWRGERWSINTQVFTWWVRDVVLLQTRQLPSYEEWLENKRYTFLLTQEQWDNLSKMTQKVPDWAIRGVSGLAKSLLVDLLKGRP